jgi:hypothetical protein
MRSRHIWFGIALALIAALLTGCGGSGGSTLVTTTSRVLAGFVYAKGNALGAGPDVVITSAATPPTGYFAPSSGTVTLSVADGTLTRAASSQIFDMSVSNAIVVTAKAAPSSSVSITGSNLTYNSVAKTLTPYSVNLGLIGSTGTVETIPSPTAPSYTPGPVVGILYTFDGVGPTAPKQLFIAGATDQFGPRTLAVVGLDSNGVVQPSAAFTVTGTAPAVVISGSSPSFTLAPDSAANSAVEGDSTITVALTGGNITGSFLANFSYGTIGTIAVTPGSSSLLWNTAGPAATTPIGVLVTNTYNAPMFNKAVTLSDPGKVAANAWIASQGTAFTATTGPTDTTGTFSTTLTAPTSVAAVAPDQTPKGNGLVTATVGSTTGTATVRVIRPLNTVVITGPTKVYVGTTTPATDLSGGAYAINSTAIDVDGTSVPVSDYPAASFTYTVTNIAGGATFGNTGDTGVTSTSVSSLIGGTNRVTAGATAGHYTMQVTGGVLVPSNAITTEVYGVPAKIFLSPDTNTTFAIAGAQGNYTGTQGQTTVASFTYLDSAGHGILPSEVTYTSQFTIDNVTGGNITSGGSSVGNFTLTFGPNKGLAHIVTTNGVWTPTGVGGSFPFNLSKDIGHDGS